MRIKKKISTIGLLFDPRPNSQEKIKKNVQQTVKRICVKISGVKGLSGLREIFRNM